LFNNLPRLPKISCTSTTQMVLCLQLEQAEENNNAAGQNLRGIRQILCAVSCSWQADQPDRPDVQLIFALCCYCGLRPNEVVALRFEDIEGDWLHVRRGFVRGRLDVPKTEGSANCVPLPEPIRKQLEIYADGKSGWLFTNGGFLSGDRITHGARNEASRRTGASRLA